MQYISALAAAAAVLVVPSIVHAKAHVQVQAGLDSMSVGGVSDEGIAYGLAAGYDIPIGERFFIGVEGSIDGSKAETAEMKSVELIPGIQIAITNRAETRRDISGVARIGARVGTRARVYVLGGYTNARVKFTGESAIIPQAPMVASLTNNLDGLRLGAGLERDFGPNFYGRIEYRYSNYEANLTRHNGFVALGFRF